MPAVVNMKVDDRRASSVRGPGSREMQELWFATRRADWRSLVLVPASPGRSAFPVAQALGEVGGVIRMSPVQLVNAEGLDLGRIATLVQDMTAGDRPAPGARGPQERAVIIAIDPVVSSPLALPIALAADAVLLCITLGETDLEAARHTADLIGRDRIVGTVLLRP